MDLSRVALKCFTSCDRTYPKRTLNHAKRWQSHGVKTGNQISSNHCRRLCNAHLPKWTIMTAPCSRTVKAFHVSSPFDVIGRLRSSGIGRGRRSGWSPAETEAGPPGRLPLGIVAATCRPVNWPDISYDSGLRTLTIPWTGQVSLALVNGNVDCNLQVMCYRVLHVLWNALGRLFFQVSVNWVVICSLLAPTNLLLFFFFSVDIICQSSLSCVSNLFSELSVNAKMPNGRSGDMTYIDKQQAAGIFIFSSSYAKAYCQIRKQLFLRKQL